MKNKVGLEVLQIYPFKPKDNYSHLSGEEYRESEFIDLFALEIGSKPLVSIPLKCKVKKTTPKCKVVVFPSNFGIEEEISKIDLVLPGSLAETSNLTSILYSITSELSRYFKAREKTEGYTFKSFPYIFCVIDMGAQFTALQEKCNSLKLKEDKEFIDAFGNLISVRKDGYTFDKFWMIKTGLLLPNEDRTYHLNNLSSLEDGLLYLSSKSCIVFCKDEKNTALVVNYFSPLLWLVLHQWYAYLFLIEGLERFEMELIKEFDNIKKKLRNGEKKIKLTDIICSRLDHLIEDRRITSIVLKHYSSMITWGESARKFTETISLFLNLSDLRDGVAIKIESCDKILQSIEEYYHYKLLPEWH